MFTSLLGELKGWFGRAFLLSVWLPVFIFAGAGLSVYLAGAGTLASAFDIWDQWSADRKAIFTAVFILVVTLIAFALEFAQVSITRLFEGYWADFALLSSLGRWRRRRYERTLERLDSRLDHLSEQIPMIDGAHGGGSHSVSLKAELNNLTEKRQLSFPPPGYESHLMPTRLGNIYKAAELYPYARYDIDSVIIWPRLREVLPDKFVERLQEIKTAVDFLLLFSLLSALFSLFSVPYLLARGAQSQFVLACAAGLPLAWLSYRAALSPAQAYAEQIKVAFDLHRHALLRAMEMRVPDTLDKEKALWHDISHFIFRGIQPPEGWQFDSQAKKSD